MRGGEIFEVGYPPAAFALASQQGSCCCTISVIGSKEDFEAGSEGEQGSPLATIRKIQQRGNFNLRLLRRTERRFSGEQLSVKQVPSILSVSNR